MYRPMIIIYFPNINIIYIYSPNINWTSGAIIDKLILHQPNCNPNTASSPPPTTAAAVTL